MEILILTVATLVGFYMAANIGSNDLANAMGTSVGSGALTLNQAVVVSILANAAGAVLAGSYVTNTISKGMIDPNLFSNSPNDLMVGMFASLLSAGIWVNLATYFALPVSTTHSIVGAVIGFGLLSVGARAISWGKVISIAASWVVSPVAGAIIGGGMFYLLDKGIMRSKDPIQASERYAPFLIFLVVIVLILSFIFKGLKNLHLHIGFLQTVLFSMPVAAVAGILGRKWIRWQMKPDSVPFFAPKGASAVDRFFSQLQVMTAFYVAFAHGANDVANAVGPLAAIFSVVKTKAVALRVEVPIWMLLIGGIAVGGGLLVFGARVMETIGKNITEINPLRGFCAEFGAATTILICSRLGLPISTTHVLVGAVVGVGFMRGMGSVDLRVLRNIAYSWIITLPFTILLCMILYKALSFAMGSIF